MTATSTPVQDPSWTATLPADRGLTIAWTAAASGGNRYTITGNEILLLRSANSGVVTVTLDSAPCDQGYSTVHDWTCTIPIGSGTEQFKVTDRISKSHFSNTVDAALTQCLITCSPYANVSMAVVKID
jgi:hypothetical protein